MPQLEPLNLKLTGSADGLTAAIGKAEGSVKGMGGSLGNILGGIGDKFNGLVAGINPATVAITAAMATIGAAAAGAAAAIGQIRQAMGRVDEEADAAARLGVSLQDLKSIRLGFSETTGADSGAVDAAIIKFQVNLAEAAQKGTGAAAEALQKLGLDANELLAKGPKQALLDVADRIGKIGVAGEQTKTIIDLLGRSGGTLAAAFREGGDGLRESMKFAEEELKITDEQAKRIGDANDAWGRLSDVVKNVWDNIAAGISPALTVVAGDAIDLIKWFREMGEKAIGIVGGFDRVVDAVAMAYGVAKDFLDVLIAFNPVITVIRTGIGDIDGVMKDFANAFVPDKFNKTMEDLKRVREEAYKSKAGASDAEIESLEKLVEAEKKAAAATKERMDAEAKAAKEAMKNVEDQIKDLERTRSGLLNELARNSSGDGILGAVSDRAGQIRKVAEVKSRNTEQERILGEIKKVNEDLVAEQKRAADLLEEIAGNPSTTVNQD